MTIIITHNNTTTTNHNDNNNDNNAIIIKIHTVSKYSTYSYEGLFSSMNMYCTTHFKKEENINL